jgi:hypothetical protein
MNGFLSDISTVVGLIDVSEIALDVIKNDRNYTFLTCSFYTGCLKIIVFRGRGLVGDILLTK